MTSAGASALPAALADDGLELRLAAAALNVFLLGAQRTSSGFRGYALPRLQFRYSALLASLILGVLWAFWHLPFVVTGEDIWIDALLFPIEWSIVYTWLFNNAKGSVLIVMLFHNMNNTFSSGFIGQMFSRADSVNQAWLRLMLWGVVAVVLVIVYGSQHLSRKHQKQLNQCSLRYLRHPLVQAKGAAKTARGGPTVAAAIDPPRQVRLLPGAIAVSGIVAGNHNHA
jgi:uncharacterized protein